MKVQILLFFLLAVPIKTWSKAPQCTQVFRTSVTLAEFSFASLQDKAKLGKRAVRRGQWRIKDQEFFRRLEELSSADLKTLPLVSRIQILNVLAQWNLLAGKKFTKQLEESLKPLSQWKAKHFLHFGLVRKLSPQEFSSDFVQSYRKNVLLHFQNWSTNTQLEVLGAEILQGAFWSQRQTLDLLAHLTENLRNQKDPLRIKPLKEFYRAMSFLRATQPSFFFEPLVHLESLLEGELKKIGLSLEEGGTSGANNPHRPLGPTFYQLINKIDEIYPNQEKVFEYMNPSHLGFFDPVDLYYPELGLVVEWDGPVHYFRQGLDGEVLKPHEYRLRPLDQAKDEILRRMGISVLRWGRQHNSLLDSLDVDSFISNQNAGVWRPASRN